MIEEKGSGTQLGAALLYVLTFPGAGADHQGDIGKSLLCGRLPEIENNGIMGKGKEVRHGRPLRALAQWAYPSG